MLKASVGTFGLHKPFVTGFIHYLWRLSYTNTATVELLWRQNSFHEVIHMNLTNYMTSLKNITHH
jgi:hypothetical protein